MIHTITQTVLQTLRETNGMPQTSRQQKANAQQQAQTIDLIALFFRILEKFWLVIILAVAGTAFMGWRASKSIPTYTATSKLYLINLDSGISISNLQLGAVMTMDYQEVFKTWEVHQRVIEELDLPYTYSQMQSLINVTNPDDTRILYITATYPDAEMAAEIANAYARAAKWFITQTMGVEEPSSFSIALTPSVARRVSRTTEMIKGFMLGSACALALITLLFLLDNRPRTEKDIEDFGGLPTLAVFPAVRRRQKAEAPADQEPQFGWNGPLMSIDSFPELDVVSLEAMNSLCTNLSYCGKDIRKIMVTSRYASEGKSYISMNLMRMMARLGKTVVLVDTDLRASGIQERYHLRSHDGKYYGLTEYLSCQCALNDIVYQTDIPNAYLIPAGHEAPNPLALLDTKMMMELMDWLGTQFDVVLMDTPPVCIVSDGVALAKFCDGSLLVVGYRKGKKDEIGTAVKQIRQTGSRMLGAVLNNVKLKNLSNKYYYYHSERYYGRYSKYRGRRASS
ncbi:MAG: polysaccharide biosynthesis tyrosine autokinase [Aristaeellaceae bacterium]